MKKIKWDWEKIRRLLPYLVLLGAWLFSVGIYAYLGTHNLDSDQSSDMVMAQLLNEEGSLISKNWYHSTELCVMGSIPVYQLGMLIFESWHMVRVFAIAVLLLGMALSFIYLMRAIGVHEAGVYASACLILPVSWSNTFTLVYGQFYTVFVIVICVMLGLLFRLKDGKRNGIKLAVLAVLSFWSGLQGVRMLMLCVAPLMMAVALIFIVRAQRCKSLREAGGVLCEIHTPGVLLICAVTMAGYVINSLVLSEMYSYQSFSESQFYDLNWNSLFERLNHIPGYFGFKSGVSLLSLDGIRNASAFVLGVGSIICLIDLFRNGEKHSTDTYFLVAFTGASVLLGLMLISMTGFGINAAWNSVAYYLPGMLLMVVLAFVCIEKRYAASAGLRTIAFLVVCMMFALNSVQYIRSSYKSDDTDYEVRAQDLLDLGYTTGFATFWNANVMAEAADGKLDVYTYNTWGDRYLYPWLQRKEHFEKPYEGKVFVLIDTVEMELQNPPLAREENLICETYNGWIYGYDSAQEVMDIQNNEIIRRRESGLSE